MSTKTRTIAIRKMTLSYSISSYVLFNNRCVNPAKSNFCEITSLKPEAIKEFVTKGVEALCNNINPCNENFKDILISLICNELTNGVNRSTLGNACSYTYYNPDSGISSQNLAVASKHSSIVLSNSISTRAELIFIISKKVV